MFDSDEISSEMGISVDESDVKWQEKSFSSWLRTGRTTLTASVENREHRILLAKGDGVMCEDLVDGVDDFSGGVLVFMRFSAMRASRSDTRAVDDGCRANADVPALVGLLVELMAVALTLFTTVWPGRGRATDPVTERSGSGDLEKANRGRLALLAFVLGDEEMVR